MNNNMLSLAVIVLTYFVSDFETRNRNTLIVAGAGAFLYFNDQKDKMKSNVLNYNIQ